MSDHFTTLWSKSLMIKTSGNSVRVKFITMFATYRIVKGFHVLKVLRNGVLCIICVWLLFCSARVYISLHFLPVILVNYRLSHFSGVFLFSACSRIWTWCHLKILKSIWLIIQVFYFIFSFLTLIETIF